MTNLRTPILRQPGQSLDEALAKMHDDDFGPIAAMIVLFIFLAILEWLRWVFPIGPQPWIASAIALIVLWWGIRRARKLRSIKDNLRLGRDGERMVAQTIAPLAADGFVILHDLPGDGFNLDHVLIGPTGVFVIETKTRSRFKKKPKVTLVEGIIHVDGRPEIDDSRGQARAAAKWLEALLDRLLGEHVPVQPVVVFPEWYVEIDRPYELPVWICNPKGLLTFIPKARRKLDREMAGKIHHALVGHMTIRQQLMHELQTK